MKDFTPSVGFRLATIFRFPVLATEVAKLIGRRIACCLSCAVIAVAALAAVAEAKIVVGLSIGGVKFGDTTAHVRAVRGKPDFIDPGMNHDPTWYWFPHHKRPANGLALYSVYFVSNHVALMFTSSTKERTSKGVGPGSTHAALAKAFPGIKCSQAFSKADWDCMFLTHYHKRTVRNDFTLIPSGKRVNQMAISYLG